MCVNDCANLEKSKYFSIHNRSLKVEIDVLAVKYIIFIYVVNHIAISTMFVEKNRKNILWRIILSANAPNGKFPLFFSLIPPNEIQRQAAQPAAWNQLVQRTDCVESFCLFWKLFGKAAGRPGRSPPACIRAARFKEDGAPDSFYPFCFGAAHTGKKIKFSPNIPAAAVWFRFRVLPPPCCARE